MKPKIPKRGISIPKGWFKLKNGKRVYITHSEFGHYPGKKGKRIIEEIEKVKPKYLLIEKGPLKGKNAVVVGASHIEIWIKNNWIKKI